MAFLLDSIKWYHTVFVSVWLISLNITPSKSFFLWLSSIPLYLYHIFFIHLSVSGHSGCLPIVNNASTNTRVHLSLTVSISVFLFVFALLLDIYPGVELLGHMVALFSVFWENIILSSSVATPNYLLELEVFELFAKFNRLTLAISRPLDIS